MDNNSALAPRDHFVNNDNNVSSNKFSVARVEYLEIFLAGLMAINLLHTRILLTSGGYSRKHSGFKHHQFMVTITNTMANYIYMLE